MNWIKSSFSNSFSNCVEVAWRQAGRCQNGECVQAGACHCGDICVRDSKDPGGPVLRFTAGEWAAFVGGVRNGEFDDLA